MTSERSNTTNFFVYFLSQKNVTDKQDRLLLKSQKDKTGEEMLQL